MDEKLNSAREIERRERRVTARIATIVAAALAAVVIFCLFTGRYSSSRYDVLMAFLYGLVERLFWALELPARLIPGLNYELTNPITVSWEQNV